MDYKMKLLLLIREERLCPGVRIIDMGRRVSSIFKNRIQLQKEC